MAATGTPFEKFFLEPAQMIDWLAHLHEKDWMDWRDFMGMTTRFRAATESYNAS